MKSMVHMYLHAMKTHEAISEVQGNVSLHVTALVILVSFFALAIWQERPSFLERRLSKLQSRMDFSYSNPRAAKCELDFWNLGSSNK